MTANPWHLPLMLALTFSTGIVDAVGFLGLDRVFTGNMTGNVVILGMALTGADGLVVWGPLVALGGFAAGAAAAGRALRGRVAGWSGRTTVLLLLVAGGMAAVALVWRLVPSPSESVALAVTGVLGAAMGLQAGTARHVAVREVTTVVVTSAITGLAADSWLGAGRGSGWQRRATSVVVILLGAAVGAVLLLRAGLAAGVAVAAVVTVAVAGTGHVELRRSGRS